MLAMSSRAAMPSSWPTVKAGPLVRDGYAWYRMLPGSMLTSKIAAAPLSSARRTAPSFGAPSIVNTNTALPLHVLSGEIGLAPEADIHRFEIEAVRRRADRSIVRLRRFERQSSSRRQSR